MTANCIPKHIPRKGILFSLANFIEFILPKTPLFPKPPGTNIPFKFLRTLLKFTDFSALIQIIFISVELCIPL